MNKRILIMFFAVLCGMLLGISCKNEKTAEEALITVELKRCADELASTDLSMQTIRDMIRG